MRVQFEIRLCGKAGAAAGVMSAWLDNGVLQLHHEPPSSDHPVRERIPMKVISEAMPVDASDAYEGSVF